LLLGGLFLLVYLSFGQSTLYRDDGLYILQGLADHRLEQARHHLAMPLFHIWVEALALVGVAPYRALTILAALGCALGLVWTHLGCRMMGLSRIRCAMATAMVGGAPPLVFYATVVEFHGPFACAAQLAFMAAAWLMQRPGARRAVILGLAVTAAGLMHSSGFLLGLTLGFMILGWSASRPPRSRRSLGRLIGIALVAQAVSTAVALLVLYRAGLLVADMQLRRFGLLAGPIETLALHLPAIVMSEWFWVYQPLASFFLLVPLRREWRAPFLGVIAGVGAFCLLSALLLSHSEWGAYLLPMAAPMAALVVHVFSARVCAAIAACGLAIGLTSVVRHDQKWGLYRDLASGLERACGDAHGILLTVSLDEWGAALLMGKEIEAWPLFSQILMPAEAIPALADLFDDLIESRRPRGGRVFVSAASLRFLESGVPTAAPWADALRAHYDLVSTCAAGFDGFELVLKRP
jgi:hypothetical protein